MWLTSQTMATTSRKVNTYSCDFDFIASAWHNNAFKHGEVHMAAN